MQNKSEVAGHIKVGIIISVVIVIIQYYTVRVNRQNFCIFIIACVRLGHVDLHADCLNTYSTQNAPRESPGGRSCWPAHSMQACYGKRDAFQNNHIHILTLDRKSNTLLHCAVFQEIPFCDCESNTTPLEKKKQKNKLKPLFIPHELQPWSHPGLFRRFPIFNAKLSGCKHLFQPLTAGHQRRPPNRDTTKVICKLQLRAGGEPQSAAASGGGGWVIRFCLLLLSLTVDRQRTKSKFKCFYWMSLQHRCACRVCHLRGWLLCSRLFYKCTAYFRNQNTHWQLFFF